MVDCLAGAEVEDDRAARRQHALILRRFNRAMQEQPQQALYIPELCRSIGVSERTLRVCCEEQLGMSPKRFLLLRRMSLARQALREPSRRWFKVVPVAKGRGPRGAEWPPGVKRTQRGRDLFAHRGIAGVTGRISAVLKRQLALPVSMISH